MIWLVNEPEDHLAPCTASLAEMNFNVAFDEAFNNAGASGDELQPLSKGSAWPSAKKFQPPALGVDHHSGTKAVVHVEVSETFHKVSMKLSRDISARTSAIPFNVAFSGCVWS